MAVDVEAEEGCLLPQVWHLQGEQRQCIEVPLGEMWKGECVRMYVRTSNIINDVIIMM